MATSHELVTGEISDSGSARLIMRSTSSLGKRVSIAILGRSDGGQDGRMDAATEHVLC